MFETEFQPQQFPIDIDIIAEIIFKNIPYEQLKKLRTVCKSWGFHIGNILRRRNISNGCKVEFSRDSGLRLEKFVNVFSHGQLLHSSFRFVHSKSFNFAICPSDETFMDFVRIVGSTTRELILDEYLVTREKASESDYSFHLPFSMDRMYTTSEIREFVTNRSKRKDLPKEKLDLFNCVISNPSVPKYLHLSFLETPSEEENESEEEDEEVENEGDEGEEDDKKESADGESECEEEGDESRSDSSNSTEPDDDIDGTNAVDWHTFGEIDAGFFRELLLTHFPNLRLLSIHDSLFPFLNYEPVFKEDDKLNNLIRFHFQPAILPFEINRFHTLSKELLRISRNVKKVKIQFDSNGWIPLKEKHIASMFNNTRTKLDLASPALGIFSTLRSIEELNLKIPNFSINFSTPHLNEISENWKKLNLTLPNIKFKKLKISNSCCGFEELFEFFKSRTSLCESLEVLQLNYDDFEESYPGKEQFYFDIPPISEFKFLSEIKIAFNQKLDLTITLDFFRTTFPLLQKLSISQCDVEVSSECYQKWPKLQSLRLDPVLISWDTLDFKDLCSCFTSNFADLKEFILCPISFNFQYILSKEELNLLNCKFLLMCDLYFKWADQKWKGKFDFSYSKGIKQFYTVYKSVYEWTYDSFYSIEDLNQLDDIYDFQWNQISSLDLRKCPVSICSRLFLKWVREYFVNLTKLAVRANAVDSYQFKDAEFSTDFLRVILECFDGSELTDLSIEFNKPVKNLEMTLLNISPQEFTNAKEEFSDGNKEQWLSENVEFENSLRNFQKLKSLHIMWDLKDFLEKKSDYLKYNLEEIRSYFITDFGMEIIFRRMLNLRHLKFTVTSLEKLNEICQFKKIFPGHLVEDVSKLPFSLASEKTSKIKFFTKTFSVREKLEMYKMKTHHQILLHSKLHILPMKPSMRKKY